MKTVLKIKRIILVVALIIASGCAGDYLDKAPLSSLNGQNFYTTSAELLSGTAPLYGVTWYLFNDKSSFALGDIKGRTLLTPSYIFQPFMNFAVDPNNALVINSWASFFAVVAQSNTIMSNIKLFSASSIADADKRMAYAECRFMRGLAYFYLIRNWGEGVPLIDDNLKYLNDTTLPRNTPESVYEFVIRDLRYAVRNLPSSPIQPGRLTKWAAEGMLAKVFLHRAGLNQAGTRDQADLDSAKYYAGDVCKNSGYTLMPNYEDLFKTQYNMNKSGVNPEGLFALLWTYGGSYGTSNAIQAQLAFASNITGYEGWGADHGANYSILSYYQSHPEDSIRRKATFFFPGEKYDYISIGYPDSLDPSKTNIRKLVVPTDGSFECNYRAHVKKYIVGRPEDNDGQVGSQQTTINTYMLRLAEVYLIYAEAILGNGISPASAATGVSDAEALKYFNLVRKRAGLGNLPSISFNDLWTEKRAEFTMEGVMWYELARLYLYAPQAAKDIIDTTHINAYTIDLIANSSPKKWKITNLEPDRTDLAIDDAHFWLPYPASEVTQAPNLNKPPVPYVFTSEE